MKHIRGANPRSMGFPRNHVSAILSLRILSLRMDRTVTIRDLGRKKMGPDPGAVNSQKAGFHSPEGGVQIDTIASSEPWKPKRFRSRGFSMGLDP